jgi:Zn-dependent protease
MNAIRKGTIPLFTVTGIAVSLHWSWFLVAAYEISGERRAYSSIGWNIAEYLGLFLIVMLHEFGHALACRQVGGIANEIVLWPLGGVAYVNPPQRPGATLWSLAAGPLVNVALAPVLYVLVALMRSSGAALATPNLYVLMHTVEYVNIVLLIFNILPIYPLDGGQILRSLLWFGIGRARSLMVAVVVGFIGVAALIVFALLQQSGWIGIIAVFILLNCWNGWRHAQVLLKIAKLPRRPGFACPSCKTAPPIGLYWGCSNCKTRFDTFETGAGCPQCRTQFPVTGCLDCGRRYPMAEWSAAALASNLVTTAGGVSPVLPSR